MFSIRLKMLRKDKDLTQEQLAQLISVERSSIGKYESQKSNVIPSPEVLLRLANALDVSVDYLLGRTEEKKPSAEIIDEELDANVLVIRGRDGRYIRKVLTDEEIQSFETLFKNLPDLPDNL